MIVRKAVAEFIGTAFLLAAVVGSGIMGSGLAEVIARGGMNVIVRSRSQATADAMVASSDSRRKKYRMARNNSAAHNASGVPVASAKVVEMAVAQQDVFDVGRIEA